MTLIWVDQDAVWSPLINTKANQVFEKVWKMQDNYGNLTCTVILIC